MWGGPHFEIYKSNHITKIIFFYYNIMKFYYIILKLYIILIILKIILVIINYTIYKKELDGKI